MTVQKSQALVNAQAFCNNLIARARDPKLVSENMKAQHQLISAVRTVPSPRNKCRLIILDIDHSLTDLYPVSSPSGFWALSMFAKRYGCSKKALFKAARNIDAEYLCHAPVSFLRRLSESTQHHALSPDNPENKDILHAWLKMRLDLNQAAAYKQTLVAIKEIKKAGALVYIATNGMKDNSFHRISLWFGDKARSLIDGVTICEDLSGMNSYNPFATRHEIELVRKMENAGDVASFPPNKLKPNHEPLLWIFNHANKKIEKSGQRPIEPDEIIMYGDSLSSDGAAKAIKTVLGKRTQFVLTTEGLVTDKIILSIHKKVGHEKDPLGLPVALDKLRKDYNRPNIVVKNALGLFDTYKFAAPSKKIKLFSGTAYQPMPNVQPVPA